MADFQKAISSLRNRSKRSRRISLAITVAVIFLAAYLFTVVAVRFSDLIHPAIEFGTGSLKLRLSERNPNGAPPVPPESLLLHLNQTLERSLGPLRPETAPSAPPPSVGKAPNQAELESLKQQVAILIDGYRSLREIDRPAVVQREGTDWSSAIASLALSVGSIGLLLLVLQIVIAFIRYYARLGELYDAQADALEASDGSADAAYLFIEKFSPSAIEFGKMPTPIYEKAIDALAQVAKGKLEPKA